MILKAYVLDASVAAKWFLNDEDLIEKARLFLLAMLANEIQLHAPVLIKYELADLLTKAKRDKNRPINSNDCLEAFSSFCELPIIFHEMDDNEILRAIEFANRFNRRVYDSSYICLARSLNLRWLTSERRFSRPLHPDFPTELILTLESAENSVKGD